MKPTAAEIRALTLHWVRRCVVGWNLCPFAAPVLTARGLRVAVSQAQHPDAAVRRVLDEARRLLEQPPARPATTLVVFPQALADWEAFLQAVASVEAVLEQAGAEGLLQLAHFHPLYVFAETAPDDPANATNRAPWPVIHLLRHADVEAVTGQGDTARIGERNAQRLRAMPASELFAAMPWLRATRGA